MKMWFSGCWSRSVKLNCTGDQSSKQIQTLQQCSSVTLLECGVGKIIILQNNTSAELQLCPTFKTDLWFLFLQEDNNPLNLISQSRPGLLWAQIWKKKTFAIAENHILSPKPGCWVIRLHNRNLHPFKSHTLTTGRHFHRELTTKKKTH